MNSVEEIKEYLIQTEIDLQINNTLLNALYEIIIFCSQLDIHCMENEIAENYSFDVPTLNKEYLYTNIIQSSQGFTDTFFSQKRLFYCIDVEKKYIQKIYTSFYSKKDEKEAGLYTICTNEHENILKTNLLDIKDTVYIVQESLEKLETLYSLEIKQKSHNVPKEQRIGELEIVQQWLLHIKTVSSYLNLLCLFSTLEKMTYEFFTMLDKALETQRISNQLRIIQKHSLFLKKWFPKRKVYFASFVALYNSLKEELHYLEMKKQSLEEEFKRLIQTLTKEGVKKELEISTKKVTQFKNEAESIKSLQNVFIKAKDVTTAIKHSEKGRELQLYFSKQTEEDIQQTVILQPRKEIQEEAPSKAEIRSWFSYGKTEQPPEQNYKSKLTNTTMGINLKDLLKENGVSEELLKNYKNQKNNE